MLLHIMEPAGRPIKNGKKKKKQGFSYEATPTDKKKRLFF
jgi:hypothetical protein